MIEKVSEIFLFLKDYAGDGRDRYFLFKDGELSEVTAADLVVSQGLLVCHDYWLIAPSIYDATGKLPHCVVDLDEFSAAISGSRDQRKQRERRDITQILSEISKSHELAKKYSQIFHKAVEFDLATYSEAAEWLSQYWKTLLARAWDADELARQIFVEIPAFNYLYQQTVSGIGIDCEILQKHKVDIDHEYYSSLKNFSDRHNFALEVPSDLAVTEYLEPLGFDFSGISVDYVLEFLSTPNDFAGDVLKLRKLAATRTILNALPSSRRLAFPIVDIFGSITSRIYFKDPVFQNLAKKYRNIIVASVGRVLTYVDFDQFEVGIMAALSSDPQMLKLYGSSDIYEVLSLEIFGDKEKRKLAKRIFLSYAYGMRIKSLVDAAVAQGATRAKVKGFFARFEVFENWKKDIILQFQTEGKIGTNFGNYHRRLEEGPLSEKEKRACVSQVVQGTASLIFKRSLLAMRDEDQVRVLIPMHDAVLFEHPPEYDPSKIASVFSDVMTEHLKGRVVGKASLEAFYVAPI